MHQIIAGLALTLLIPGPGLAQDVKIPDRIEKLAAKASETVNVTLDGPLLQMAGRFLNSKSADEQLAKDVLSKLRSINVRTFEFATAGEYSEADVAGFRSQLRSPAWSRVFDTNSKQDGEHVEIYLKQEKNQAAGLVIIASEPKELTIVSIDGAIDLKQLTSLGGQLGIPKIDVNATTPAAGTASKTPPDTKGSPQ